jgi:hypothetical protein
MSSKILSAPVTEFAFITLKEGKESERGDLERAIDELQREISTATGFHASSWGKSVDPGKKNVYIFVLGWDTAAVECYPPRRKFMQLMIYLGALGGCWTRDNMWRIDRKEVATDRTHRLDACRYRESLQVKVQ